MGVSGDEAGIIIGVALAFALVIALIGFVLSKVYPAKPARKGAAKHDAEEAANSRE